MVTAFHFLEKDFHLQMILVHIPGQPPNVDLRRLERIKIYNQYNDYNIQLGLEMDKKQLVKEVQAKWEFT